jgi:two-component system CheB/CheR fusion protein
MNNEDDQQAADFEVFLKYLSSSRHFDFTAYKRASLRRRVDKRMQVVSVSSYSDYTDYLEVHPEEFTELFNTILINVTSFFRDPPAWELLAEEVVPRILAAKRQGDAIRIWSAGCASGEEAYSLAMIFAEAMGEPDFRRRVKIYATDVDEDALNTARQATYTTKDLAAVPEELRTRYFDGANGRHTFHKDLRRAVIFGRHDLLNDAPISRIDLLVCRNTLMYLNSEGQGRVLSRFFFALSNGGVLFLGKAETLLTHTSALTPIDLKLRLFSKAAHPNLRDQLALVAQDGSDEAQQVVNQLQIRDVAFEVDPVPMITVDVDGTVIGMNERARSLFSTNAADIGRKLQDLELSYRPVELRSLIDQAYGDSRPVSLREVEWQTGGAQRWLDITVLPLRDGLTGVLGVKIIFNDVTRFKELQRQLQQSKNELETAYEELQSTNEELETTNEELQSTVEELETTNEELQSTNEELETMNEELQSTNEELETVNHETRQRSVELNGVNAFLESILTSMRDAVVVLDRDFAVRAWNSRAEDLWGLRTDEVRGAHFLNLDIGLPVDRLRQPIRDCLAQTDGPRGAIEVTARNRRGREILCRINCMPLHDASGNVEGVILLMGEAQASGA